MGGGITRLGVLGGTFDPPHLGHLWLAETAREQLALDQVLFLPVGQPPHKGERPITAVSHRLRMTELATAADPGFVVSRIDCDRPPPHTTITLLPLLKARQPDAELWLIIGGDSLRDLPSWVQPQQLIKQCRLAVLPRPGAVIAWEALETAVPGAAAVVDMLAGPTVDISSTAIRHWASTGHSLNYLVDTAVRAYIAEASLYTSQANL